MASDTEPCPYVEAVLGSLSTAERHVDSEYVDEHEETLASVSRQPRYAMMPEPGTVRVITDSAGVASFYEDARKAFLPGASRIVAQIATDWYVFLENVPTRIDASTGIARTLHTATLFPKAPDGIRGEFLWERDANEEPPDGFTLANARGPVPHLAARNLGLHERFLGALCQGSEDALRSMLDDRCIWATRNYLADAAARPMAKLEGPGEVASNFAAWLETFELERISILNRIATDWYVFAEELLVIRPRSGAHRGERREYRKASIYPVTPAGRLQGELGFGTDIEQASPSSETTLGAAFWERQDSARPHDPALTRRSV